MNIKYLYENTELTLQNIADKLGLTYKQVWKYVAKNYSSQYRRNRKTKTYRNSKLGIKNHMCGKSGDSHHNYVGIVSDNKGYLMVLKPEWYTGRKKSKHVFLHHVVMCQHKNITEIPKGYCVHHIDHDPHNNDISNLQLMTIEDHSRLHNVAKRATTSPNGRNHKRGEAQDTH